MVPYQVPISSDEADELVTAVQASPILGPILQNWQQIELPDCWLVAGAVAQTIWNQKTSKPADHGLRDIDLVYFDAEDLSSEAEQVTQRRIADLFKDLPVQMDVKNEARVHIWYEARFGFAIAPYGSTREAIKTFPTTATTVGIRPKGDQFEIAAPFGLTDLMALVVRPNKIQITEDIYVTKVARWRELWPELKIISWTKA